MYLSYERCPPPINKKTINNTKITIEKASSDSPANNPFLVFTNTIAPIKMEFERAQPT